MSVQNVVVPNNLGVSFDVGNKESDKIHVNYDNVTIKLNASNELYVTSYEKCVIWAEENGPLNANQAEFSFGNGAVSNNNGIVLVENWEVYGVSSNAETFSAGANYQLQILKNGAIVHTETITANNVGRVLLTPVQFAAGDVINFRTGTKNGTITDVRVAAWLRRKPT